eukprot:scaffold123339_cov66-Phaeocystis_antarctica.AAC.1
MPPSPPPTPPVGCTVSVASLCHSRPSSWARTHSSSAASLRCTRLNTARSSHAGSGGAAPPKCSTAVGTAAVVVAVDDDDDPNRAASTIRPSGSDAQRPRPRLHQRSSRLAGPSPPSTSLPSPARASRSRRVSREGVRTRSAGAAAAAASTAASVAASAVLAVLAAAAVAAVGAAIITRAPPRLGIGLRDSSASTSKGGSANVEASRKRRRSKRVSEKTASTVQS